MQAGWLELLPVAVFTCLLAAGVHFMVLLKRNGRHAVRDSSSSSNSSSSSMASQTLPPGEQQGSCIPASNDASGSSSSQGPGQAVINDSANSLARHSGRGSMFVRAPSVDVCTLSTDEQQPSKVLQAAVAAATTLATEAADAADGSRADCSIDCRGASCSTSSSSNKQAGTRASLAVVSSPAAAVAKLPKATQQANLMAAFSRTGSAPAMHATQASPTRQAALAQAGLTSISGELMPTVLAAAAGGTQSSSAADAQRAADQQAGLPGRAVSPNAAAAALHAAGSSLQESRHPAAATKPTAATAFIDLATIQSQVQPQRTAAAAAATEAAPPEAPAAAAAAAAAVMRPGAPKQILPAGASASAATNRGAGPAAATAAAAAAAAPVSLGQAAGGRTAAAAAGPPRPSSLYTSPMQHITVSIKVPLPYAPTAAHVLQDCVAQHVVSSAAAQQPPQHTVMHMVSVPGCIQLLMSVVQWRQGQQPPELPAAAAAAAAAAQHERQQQLQQQASAPQAVAGMFGLAGTMGPAPDTSAAGNPQQQQQQQLLYSHSNASESAVASTVITGPAAAAPCLAPAWMVQAICRGVEQFMRMQAGEAVTPPTIHPTTSTSTTSMITTPPTDAPAPARAAAAGIARADAPSSALSLEPCSGEDPSCVQQRLLGAPGPAVAALQLSPAAWPAPPALIDINGQRYQLQPDPFDAAAPWTLHLLEQGPERPDDQAAGPDDQAGVAGQATGVRHEGHQRSGPHSSLGSSAAGAGTGGSRRSSRAVAGIPEHGVLPALPAVGTAAGAWQTLAVHGMPAPGTHAAQAVLGDEAGTAAAATATADPFSEPSFARYLTASQLPAPTQLLAPTRPAGMTGGSTGSSGGSGPAGGSFWTATEEAQPQLMHMVPAGSMGASAAQGTSPVQQQQALEQQQVQEQQLQQQQQQQGVPVALPAICEEPSVGSSSRRSSRSSLAGGTSSTTARPTQDAAVATPRGRDGNPREAAAGETAVATTGSATYAAAAGGVVDPGPDPSAGLDVMGPLPSGVWAWPLCLPVTGSGSGSSSSSLAASSSSSRSSSAATAWLPVPPAATSLAGPAAAGGSGQPPVVAVHGLSGSACRIVVINGPGDVLADCHCELQEGIARIQPAASGAISKCTLYVLAPHDSSAPAVPAAPAPAGIRTAFDTGTASSSASSNSSSRAGGRQTPFSESLDAAADRVLFALPVLYLPPAVVVELNEAGRALLLEQTLARLVHDQQQSHLEPEYEYFYMYLTDTDAAAAGGARAGDAPELQQQQQRSAPSLYAPAAASSSAVGGSLSSIDSYGHSRHIGSFETSRRLQGSSFEQPRQQRGRRNMSSQLPNPAAGSSSSSQQQQQLANVVVHEPAAAPLAGAAAPTAGVAGEAAAAAASGAAANMLSASLDDEQHMLKLRGRLFAGSDVHQLLQQQLLALLADVGLLIDLAAEGDGARAAAVAAARAGGATTASSSSSGLAGPTGMRSTSALIGEASEASKFMAASVGQQLLGWAGAQNAWSFCQLVLSLLDGIGVQLQLHGQLVGQDSYGTLAAVQQLLTGHQAVAADGAMQSSGSSSVYNSALSQEQAAGSLPTHDRLMAEAAAAAAATAVGVMADQASLVAPSAYAAMPPPRSIAVSQADAAAAAATAAQAAMAAAAAAVEGVPADPGTLTGADVASVMSLPPHQMQQLQHLQQLQSKLHGQSSVAGSLPPTHLEWWDSARSQGAHGSHSSASAGEPSASVGAASITARPGLVVSAAVAAVKSPSNLREASSSSAASCSAAAQAGPAEAQGQQQRGGRGSGRGRRFKLSLVDSASEVFSRLMRRHHTGQHSRD